MGLSSEQQTHIRSVYLEQRRNLVDVARLTQLLSQAGFRYTPESQTISWDTQEIDFQLFDAVLAFLRKTTHYEEEAFETALLAFLESLFSPWTTDGIHAYTDTTVPLFIRLQDPNLPRSIPHQKRTPFEHSLDVLGRATFTPGLLSGEVVDEGAVFWRRFEALMHDLGKVAIAQHDYSHDHGFISSLIVQQYFTARGIDTPPVAQALSHIRDHHLLELSDRGREAFSIPEGMEYIRHSSRVGEDQAAFLHTLRGQIELSLADSMSVPEYQVFSIFVIRTFYEMYISLSPEDQVVLHPFVLQLCDLACKLITRVEADKAYTSVRPDLLPSVLQGILEVKVIVAREFSRKNGRFEQIRS